jgi:hypothetical protein
VVVALRIPVLLDCRKPFPPTTTSTCHSTGSLNHEKKEKEEREAQRNRYALSGPLFEKAKSQRVVSEHESMVTHGLVTVWRRRYPR